MIAFLRGQIIAKRLGSVIIENNDIGYQVLVGERLLNSLTISQTADFFTFHNVKEDSEELYGFADLEELALFELLVSVSGVGPKSALNVLSLADIKQIQQAIVLGDEDMLTQVSGIGRKTAQRLILELKNKMNIIAVDNSSPTVLSGQDDLEALLALGYGSQDARRALAKVDPLITDPAQRLKSALQQLR